MDIERDGQAVPAGAALLRRGAALCLLLALVLAWCLVGLNFGVDQLKLLFPGKVTRVLQAHIDFLLMSALILGFHGARVPLPRHVRWPMVIGAVTNSSLFLLLAAFPQLDAPPPPPEGLLPAAFQLFRFASIVITSWGFGAGAVTLLRSASSAR